LNLEKILKQFSGPEMDLMAAAGFIYVAASRRCNGEATQKDGLPRITNIREIVLFAEANIQDIGNAIVGRKPAPCMRHLLEEAIEMRRFYLERAERADTCGPTDEEKGEGTMPHAVTGRKPGQPNKGDSDEEPNGQASEPTADDTSGPGPATTLSAGL
jgi:hypothetical protein